MDSNKKQNTYLNINLELESCKFYTIAPAPHRLLKLLVEFNQHFKELDIYKLNSFKDKSQIINVQQSYLWLCEACTTMEMVHKQGTITLH
jgi:hypothetical protein